MVTGHGHTTRGMVLSESENVQWMRGRTLLLLLLLLLCEGVFCYNVYNIYGPDLS